MIPRLAEGLIVANPKAGGYFLIMLTVSIVPIQGGSLARRTVVAEFQNNPNTPGTASNKDSSNDNSNNNNDDDDDDDDFDYEPAKSKRRVSSASTERVTSPSSGAEVSNRMYLYIYL